MQPSILSATFTPACSFQSYPPKLLCGTWSLLKVSKITYVSDLVASSNVTCSAVFLVPSAASNSITSASLNTYSYTLSKTACSLEHYLQAREIHAVFSTIRSLLAHLKLSRLPSRPSAIFIQYWLILWQTLATGSWRGYLGSFQEISGNM